MAKASNPTPDGVHVDTIAERPSRTYLKKFYAKVRELAGAAGDVLTSELFTKAIKHARAHAGGVASAAKRKMPKATAELVKFERAFLAAADGPMDVAVQTGLMICFYLSDDTAAQIAIPDGEAPADLHLTLAFLGDFRQYGEMAKAEILTCVQELARWSAPITGEVSGTGRFTGEGDTDVFYASVDCPGLAEFRTDLVRRLANRGTPIQTEHGFDPHITLAYIAADAPTPSFNFGDVALRFDSIFCVFGDNEVEIPMTGMSSPGVAGMYTEVVDLCAEDRSPLESGEAMRLFVEQPQIFAAPPAVFNFLPKPGEYTHPDYGKMVFTRERNQRFVDNFKQGVYQEKLPIDCEHDLAQSGAVGWIVDLNLNADGSVDAKPEWNDRGVALIEGDRFKYFSPAWFEKWTEPVSTTSFRDVAIGGAICKRPFFKEGSLRPLVASESGLRIANSAVKATDDGGTVEIFFTTLTPQKASTTQPANEGVTMTIKFDAANPPKTMADAIALCAALQTELTAKEAALVAKEGEVTTAMTQAVALCDPASPPKTLTEAITVIGEKATAGARTATEKDQEARQLTEKVVKLTERIDASEKANRVLRFTDIAKGFVGDRAGHVAMLEHLFAADPAKGEEGDLFKSYVTRESATAAQMKAGGLFNEVGSDAGAPQSATEQLEVKARKMVEDSVTAGKPITIEVAMDRVAQAEPKLFTEHVQAQRQASSAA